jgi:predicted dehydrogenase
LIRGHEGSIIMVDHGMFEGETDHITVIPEKKVMSDAYKSKYGDDEIKIAVEDKPRWAHMQNFLDCVRSRQKPTLDVETAFRAQVTISMAVQSYREGRVLYWDEKNLKVLTKPPKA